MISEGPGQLFAGAGAKANIHELVGDRERLLTTFKNLNKWRTKVHKRKTREADEDRRQLLEQTALVRGNPEELAKLQSEYGAGLRNQWPRSKEEFKRTFIGDESYNWV
jgi:hypothetical protein